MITIVKWVVTALLTGLVLLIGNYTTEYFKPYRKS